MEETAQALNNEDIKMAQEEEIKDLGDYVDGMLGDISKEKGLSKLNLIVEYQQLADTLRLHVMDSNNYQPIPYHGEIKIYEAAIEAIFNKYIK